MGKMIENYNGVESALPMGGEVTGIALESASETRLRQVQKRDGQVVSWDRSRIERAIMAAYRNVLADRKEAGTDEESLVEKVARLSEGVEWAVWHRYPGEEPIPIEAIQDVVETCLAAGGDWEVARAYVRYRTQRAERRPRRHEQNGMREFIAISKYARFRQDLGRREVWHETVQRVRDMHLRRFAAVGAARPTAAQCERIRAELDLTSEEARLLHTGQPLFEEIWEAFDAVEQRRALPSMRSLQFGGAAVEANEARLYNCSFSHANRVEFFRECFYLLLSGVGVGFSVQKHHVAQLTKLPERKADEDLPVRHLEVGDTIEGWSDAVDLLFRSYYEGWLAEFSFAKIRAKGSPLVTSGGKAPGHLPLKRSLLDINQVLREAAGRHLKPIEVYDIVMYIARAVLSGGVRRSATLCLFSPEDEEMAGAKTGNWFERHSHRAFSNNSALLLREDATREVFDQLFQRIKDSGEPGFYFAEDREYGANPCVEIGLCPRAVVDAADIVRLRELGYEGDLQPGDALTGWQMCNLTTINGAAIKNRRDFLEATRYASLIGTLQAAYSRITYLGPVTQFLNEREALLGVSICGVLDNPEILLDPATLQSGARIARATNQLFAELIGINPAARTTCVKPEGTASLLLGAGSGIHPHHARRYFRRVQANRVDPVYRHFRQNNAHLTEPSVYSPQSDDVVTFPVEAPPTALCRADVSALRFLNHVLTVQKNWVQSGSAETSSNPGLCHNVSNTVTVQPGEWPEVADFIWENRHAFTGIALLSGSGDKTFKQAPLEEVVTPEDIARWNSLTYEPVNYEGMSESHDSTTLADVAACAGGKCDLV